MAMPQNRVSNSNISLSQVKLFKLFAVALQRTELFVVVFLHKYMSLPSGYQLQ